MECVSSVPTDQITAEVPASYRQLRAALEQWAPILEPQWQALRSIFQPRTVRAQEHIILPGADNQVVYPLHVDVS
jgi:hypothetical protein